MKATERKPSLRPAAHSGGYLIPRSKALCTGFRTSPLYLLARSEYVVLTRRRSGNREFPGCARVGDDRADRP